MIKNLQSLRFVFIILIVLFHINGKNYEVCGDCGISFFLMLSGFVLSYAYGQQVLDGRFQTFLFIKKQLIKLYPLHLLMLVVIALLDARLGRYYEWWQLLPSIMMIQSWFPHDSFIHVANASSWFLGTLLFGYLVFSWLIRIIYRSSWLQLAVGGVIFLILYEWGVSFVPLQHVNNIVCLSPYLRLPDFCIGIILCRCWQSQKGVALAQIFQSWSVNRATLCELSSVAFVALAFLLYNYLPSCVRCSSLFWLFLPPLLMVFVCGDSSEGLLTKLFHQPMLLLLGGITMEIYLTHNFVIRVFYNILHNFGLLDGDPSVIQASINVPLIIVCAYTFHRWFTQPVQQKISFINK